ncbi:MAG: NTP transferase domain-containing protein [Firmicutes bacterium]|jgi:bifunctional UDP-N-acetylglucosamine pyrophosphorylase/glucosamine-1-phosphate N-acetyltransferase|nr:NTP transferase domain-containing protein [Bacillota bacterium]
MKQTSAIVLAAGLGKRMNSELPKPLHPICGRAMITHVLDALIPLGLEKVVVVVGHGARLVIEEVSSFFDGRLKLEFVEQHTPLGTGDAVKVALTCFSDAYESNARDSDILILPGDAPLILTETLSELIRVHQEHSSVATLLSVFMGDPTGYGRILRDKHGNVSRIVEEKDADPEEKLLNEVGTSVYVFRQSALTPALRILSPKNAQNEYYLTDVIEVLRNVGYEIKAVTAADESEVAGVNDRAQLALAESELRRRINALHMANGVTMADPGHVYIDKMVEIEKDVTLLPGVILQGTTYVASGSVLGPFVRLQNCRVGSGSRIEFASLCDMKLEDDTVISLAPERHIR